MLKQVGVVVEKLKIHLRMEKHLERMESDLVAVVEAEVVVEVG